LGRNRRSAFFAAPQARFSSIPANEVCRPNDSRSRAAKPHSALDTSSNTAQSSASTRLSWHGAPAAERPRHLLRNPSSLSSRSSLRTSCRHGGGDGDVNTISAMRRCSTPVRAGRSRSVSPPIHALERSPGRGSRPRPQRCGATPSVGSSCHCCFTAMPHLRPRRRREVLNYSQLPGYRTGAPCISSSQPDRLHDPAGRVRSSRYCTDIAKMIEAPIFHVNGDDPERLLRGSTRARFPAAIPARRCDRHALLPAVTGTTNRMSPHSPSPALSHDRHASPSVGDSQPEADRRRHDHRRGIEVIKTEYTTVLEGARPRPQKARPPN